MKTFEEEGMILMKEEGASFLAPMLLSLFGTSIRILFNVYVRVRAKKSVDTQVQPKEELVRAPENSVFSLCLSVAYPLCIVSGLEILRKHL